VCLDLKISCQACSTRYSVPDQKVQGEGRTFKIRCKQCGEMIVLKGTAVAPDSTKPGTELSEPKPGELKYYYAVGAERHGPLRAVDLAQLVWKGEVSATTYVWRSGMPSWVHLEDVPALRAALQPSTPPSSSPAAKPAPGAGRTAPVDPPVPARLPGGPAGGPSRTPHAITEPFEKFRPPQVAARASRAPRQVRGETDADTTSMTLAELTALLSRAERAELNQGGLRDDDRGGGGAQAPDAIHEPRLSDLDDTGPQARSPELAIAPPAWSGRAEEVIPSAEVDTDGSPFGTTFETPFATVGNPAEVQSSIPFEDPVGAPDVVSSAPSADAAFAVSASSSEMVHTRRDTSNLFQLHELSADMGNAEEVLLDDSGQFLEIEVRHPPIPRETVGPPQESRSRPTQRGPRNEPASGFPWAAVLGGVFLGGVGFTAWLLSQDSGTREVAAESPSLQPREMPKRVVPAEDVKVRPGAGEVGLAGTPMADAGPGEARPEAVAAPADAPRSGDAGELRGETVTPTTSEGSEPRVRTAPVPSKKNPAPRAPEGPTGGSAPEPTPKEAPKPEPEPPEPALAPLPPGPKPSQPKSAKELMEALGSPGGTTPPPDAAGLPKRLANPTIMSTLRSHHGRFKECFKQQAPLLEGNVTLILDFEIKGSGAVAGAKVATGGGTSAAVQTCVKQALGSIKFPAFQDVGMPVTYPLRLQ
jgi:predicted Zn finger-like uncharacterized protein